MVWIRSRKSYKAEYQPSKNHNAVWENVYFNENKMTVGEKNWSGTDSGLAQALKNND